MSMFIYFLFGFLSCTILFLIITLVIGLIAKSRQKKREKIIQQKFEDIFKANN